MSEQPELAAVVALCRAIRHDDLPGTRCPHCAAPRPDTGAGPATVLPLPVGHPDGDDVLAGEL